MSQDLRRLFEKDRDQKYQMKSGHEERFMQRLDASLPRKKRSFSPLWKIAASILILLGIGAYLLTTMEKELPVNTSIVNKDDTPDQSQGISLGDLSPDLRKIENYYVANINLGLAQLEVSADNKVLVDSFMERLAELNIEYNALNRELNEIGPNDHTITALIKNLQLRLDLLHKLKSKLNELKSSRNEQVRTNSI